MEHSTFTPLVMSTTGGMSRAATTFFKRLASLFSEKKKVSYSKTMGWIRCHLSFALLRASIMSIKGARSSASHRALEGLQEPFDLTCTEMITIVLLTLFFMFVFLMTRLVLCITCLFFFCFYCIILYTTVFHCILF